MISYQSIWLQYKTRRSKCQCTMALSCLHIRYHIHSHAIQYNTKQRAHDESYAYNTIATRHSTTAHSTTKIDYVTNINYTHIHYPPYRNIHYTDLTTLSYWWWWWWCESSYTQCSWLTPCNMYEMTYRIWKYTTNQCCLSIIYAYTITTSSTLTAQPCIWLNAFNAYIVSLRAITCC